MTTPASFPSTTRPRTSQGRFYLPKNLGFKFIPVTAKPSLYLRSSKSYEHSNKNDHSKSEPSSDSFFGRIQKFFQPISKIFND